MRKIVGKNLFFAHVHEMISPLPNAMFFVSIESHSLMLQPVLKCEFILKTGNGCASVLNTISSKGKISSGPKRRYKYFSVSALNVSKKRTNRKIKGERRGRGHHPKTFHGIPLWRRDMRDVVKGSITSSISNSPPSLEGFEYFPTPFTVFNVPCDPPQNE